MRGLKPTNLGMSWMAVGLETDSSGTWFLDKPSSIAERMINGLND